jgi:hypothetical protein
MSEDTWLIVLVFATWAVLALLYAFVPMFAMPGSTVVWGGGGALFLALAALIALAERRRKRD